MPPSIQQSNAKHYKSDTITEVKEFAGPHLLPPAPGWEEVADYALDWALEHAAQPERRVSGVRITHIGGPTVLHRGRRLAAADRPDVRPPRPAATASAGARRRASWPARRSRPPTSAPIDAVLLTHDHHGDNLDDAGRALLPSAGAVVTTVVGRAAAGRRRARAGAVGRPRASRRRAGRRSRSPRRRAATARRSAGRSSAT